MTKIINLLEKAKLAKQIFFQDVESDTAFGRDTWGKYLCHIFDSVNPSEKENFKDWFKAVEPFMTNQITTGWNNIASHVSATVGDYEQGMGFIKRKVAQMVRAKWLDDLVIAAEQHGDDAQLPNIMSQDEIKELYESLKGE